MSTYLTWHTERVSRHILIEFFSRSGNAGISRRYYYIFRRYAALPSLSLFLFHSLSLSLSLYRFIRLSPFSPRRGNTLRNVFCLSFSFSLTLSPLSSLFRCGAARRRGAYISGSLYLRHCCILIALSLSSHRPRRIAVLRDILHISAYRPRRFRHCSLGPPPHGSPAPNPDAE